ncbi:MAG: Rne/Rng family ribonuclease [Candidatus Brocadiia bacterium]
MPTERPTGRYMLINVFEQDEIRIAICNGDEVAGFFLERKAEEQLTGNIYRGRVENIVPSLQAAFVNIGEARNGFIHISDLIYPDGGYRGLIPKRKRKAPPADNRQMTIQEVLYEGQELLVQVTKEGIGQKGPALTTYLSLPGRYLVLMPALQRKGVSLRIEDEDTRSKLKDLLKTLAAKRDFGVIVRTAGSNVGIDAIKQDFRYLEALWEAIKRTVKASAAPALIYKESDLVLRAIRDIFTDDITACYIDEKTACSRVREFMRALMPSSVDRIKDFAERVPIFDHFKIEDQIASLAQRKIPLQRGAQLVIDQTEAMVTIDVNSGRLKEETFSETLLSTNLVAAKEIARQIRLRDLSGLIVIDFIDMDNPAHRKQLYDEFCRFMAEDKARKMMSPLSEFCVLELTRQRQRTGLARSLFQKCETCGGRGYIESVQTTTISILRKVRKGMSVPNAIKVEAAVHPHMSLIMLNAKRREVTRLEDFYGCGVVFVVDPTCTPEDVKVTAVLENGEKVVVS